MDIAYSVNNLVRCLVVDLVMACNICLNVAFIIVFAYLSAHLSLRVRKMHLVQCCFMEMFTLIKCRLLCLWLRGDL